MLFPFVLINSFEREPTRDRTWLPAGCFMYHCLLVYYSQCTSTSLIDLRTNVGRYHDPHANAVQDVSHSLHLKTRVIAGSMWSIMGIPAYTHTAHASFKLISVGIHDSTTRFSCKTSIPL
ncbi:hypothetical protein M378DRAFT_805503 [Amanita muscaria Koide BX008]|uniref:Uncharacterized protein n=1 Tax=Amanita muscaria (strain Koide BX008) TaxID=946122 RepID=A0A0C2T6C1_AMAMK|nr:hypothetical protein M378DRAFT_805503 [Amanita muscaria Koide BX008]